MTAHLPHLRLPAAAAITALVFSSCSTTKDDNLGYDTSDPYGIPDYGAETGSYDAIQPPLDSTYSPAAYEDTTPPPPRRAASPAPVATRSHTVVRGDTLWGLSRKYGVSVDAIRSANNLRGDTIVIGRTLRIPAR